MASKHKAETCSTSRVSEFAIVFVSALIIGATVYAPALQGPFVFDDLTLPYASPQRGGQPLSAWLSNVRPLLFLSFWFNFVLSGTNTLSYHLFNVLLHAANATLAFYIIRRLLVWGGVGLARGTLISAFGAAAFLIHPLQTESVAYVAGRSESLAALFVLSAYLLFLHRTPGKISWPVSVAILLMFGAACATKEHAVALAPLMLLTDYWFRLGGTRGNWRLYVPIGGASLLALAGVWHVLRSSASAGFTIQEFTWYEYFLTQCRVILLYIRLFFFPIGQSIDPDVSISRALLQRGALFALLILLAAVFAAWNFRRRYKLATFGFLMFLLLLAPTSSFVPLRDVAAEHRMYLPLLGLIVALAGLARRIDVRGPGVMTALASILVVMSLLSYQRNQIWASSVALWEDTIRGSPKKARPYANLASVYLGQRNCAQAAGVFRQAPPAMQPDYYALVTWGLAEDCLGNHDQAISLFRKASGLRAMGEHPARIHTLIGLSLLKSGRKQEAFLELQRAVDLDPNWDVAYVYRGQWYDASNQRDQAVQDYTRALQLNPSNSVARTLLASLEHRHRYLPSN